MNQKAKDEAIEGVMEGKLTVGNFTLQAQMPMGKTITVSGYIYSDSTVEAINKQVDLFHDVVDRQRLRSEIPELEAKMEQRMAALANMRDALQGLENKKSGGAKLASAEKKMIDDMNTSITRVLDDIEKGEKAISDAKLKVEWTN